MPGSSSILSFFALGSHIIAASLLLLCFQYTIIYSEIPHKSKKRMNCMIYKRYNLIEFQRRFASEEACLEAIFRSRWPHGFQCPKCGHSDGTRLSKRRSIQCGLCRRQTSITAGTIFHKTKVPLTIWFWLIFLMTQDKGGISTMRASALLGMHYTTVWNLMHKLRIAMADRLEGPLLSGYVEIDDAFFGGRSRKKRGRGAFGKKQVCIMVERLNRKAGDAAMVVMARRDASDYRSIVAAHLEPMTHIRTDGLPRNSILHGVGAKLIMDKIAKPEDHGPIENADRVISLAKRHLLGTYHQYCSRAHLQRFLNEFCYRFNRRYEWHELATRLVSACALHAPVPYAAIS